MNITLSETIQLIILIVLVYLCIYNVIDRICKCKETCAEYKAFADYNKIKNKIEKDENEIEMGFKG